MHSKKNKILIYICTLIVLSLVIQAFIKPIKNIYAQELHKKYIINGKEISFDDVEWPGKNGCWEYTSKMYEKIWGVQMEESFEGYEEYDLNLLRNLNDQERLFTEQNAEVFIKYSEPGALIRIFDAVSTDPNFEKDGQQVTSTYGHSIIIAKIYDEGFVAFESLSTGTQEKFYTWEEFYDTWSANNYEGQSRYKYFKYIKWPTAPALSMTSNSSNIETNTTDNIEKDNWTLFIILLCASIFAFCIAIIVLSILRKKIGVKDRKLSKTPLMISFVMSVIFLGVFFAWSSAITAVVILATLLYCYYINGKIKIKFDSRMIIGILLSVAYGLTSLWAVDKGVAPYGFVKSLIVFLFVLNLQQYDEEEKVNSTLISYIPWIGAAITILSFVMSFIPTLQDWFTINERISGTFQYPNTFAIFLLSGLVILAFQNTHKWIHLPLAIILIAGILLSGSRITFVLMLVTALAIIVIVTKGKKRLVLIGIEIFAIGVVVAIALLWKDGPIARFIQMAAGSSELLGRFLYMKDSLPIILKNPFGLGYLGYYYSQGSFQTGVYSVMSVHNGLLQLFLDIGWIPTIIIAAIFIRALFKSKKNWMFKVIVLVILAHSMLDFDLDFMCIWIVLLLVLNNDNILEVFKSIDLSNKTLGLNLFMPIGIVCSAFLINLGAANFSQNYIDYKTTLKIYPNDTSALMEKIINTDSMEEIEFLGKKIISLDKYVAIGHDALANVAYSKGEMEQMLLEKQEAIACAKYSNEEYIDYCDKLIKAREQYLKQGSKESADFCASEISRIPEMMDNLLAKTDRLAMLIKDKPELSLTIEQNLYIETLK